MNPYPILVEWVDWYSKVKYRGLVVGFIGNPNNVQAIVQKEGKLKVVDIDQLTVVL